MVDDRPGELARLLAELGELGINLEDLRLEHSPGAQVGLAEIAVLPEVLTRTVDDLTARGWRIAG
jgi:prephenate dehydrogenase